jgi:hypothetical protein
MTLDYLVKPHARRQRRRAESSAAARRASSRERNKTSGSTAAAGAALRNAAMKIADYSGVFFIFMSAPNPGC